MNSATELLRTEPVLQSIKLLADSVCEQCFRMANCVAVGHALQRVVPNEDLFGYSTVRGKRFLCCFSITGHAQQDRIQGVTHWLAATGQCQAWCRDERNFAMMCRNNHDTIALHGMQGALVMFCEAHRVDALNHKVCVCGVFPAGPQPNFIECANGHLYHLACGNANGGCPHGPCYMDPREEAPPGDWNTRRSRTFHAKRPEENRTTDLRSIRFSSYLLF